MAILTHGLGIVSGRLDGSRDAREVPQHCRERCRCPAARSSERVAEEEFARQHPGRVPGIATDPHVAAQPHSRAVVEKPAWVTTRGRSEGFGTRTMGRKPGVSVGDAASMAAVEGVAARRWDKMGGSCWEIRR
jgi:hypothetical protein